jgi:hypothetical protein
MAVRAALPYVPGPRPVCTQATSVWAGRAGAGPAAEAEGWSGAASPRATAEGAHAGRQRRDQAPRAEQQVPEGRALDAAGARWRWRRKGGAVEEAVEVPPEPPAPRPAWQTFLQRVQAQLPRRGGSGSAAEL